MDYHPAVDIFPLDEEHIPDLAKDIKKNGLLCPIETIDGKIIDGRRRFLACKKAKVEPQFVNVKSLVEDPIAYVLSLNLERRHLTVSQAGMCRQRARKMYDEEAKERQRQSGGRGAKKGSDKCSDLLETGKASDQVGKAFGVSGGTVDRAARVQTRGIPALSEAVDAGKLSVAAAASIATQPEELQQPLLEAAIQKKHQKSPKAKPDKSEPEPEPGKLRGKGIFLANEAIGCLKRIPTNDALRNRGFQLVTDWIRHNK